MNTLGRRIVKAMEESPVGSMSVFIYTKQCRDAGINPDAIRPEELPLLVQRLNEVLPYFAGKKSNEIIQKISMLSSNHGESRW
ncbi:MAG: hypothetical protein N3F63_01720 [Thermoplasmata archaeon]|nr:hypothetical protein [Thermoplasmata archaeon]